MRNVQCAAKPPEITFDVGIKDSLSIKINFFGTFFMPLKWFAKESLKKHALLILLVPCFHVMKEVSALAHCHLHTQFNRDIPWSTY